MKEYITLQTALIELYKDYVKILGEEINDASGIAIVHGWESKQPELGHELRKQIKLLTNKLKQFDTASS